jgi:hypothetical protein
MAITVQIHFSNEEPILAEVEALPATTDTLLTAINPRQRDGKDLRFIVPNVTAIMVPISRITYIQIMPSSSEERLVGIVRD